MKTPRAPFHFPLFFFLSLSWREIRAGDGRRLSCRDARSLALFSDRILLFADIYAREGLWLDGLRYCFLIPAWTVCEISRSREVARASRFFFSWMCLYE